MVCSWFLLRPCERAFQKVSTLLRFTFRRQFEVSLGQVSRKTLLHKKSYDFSCELGKILGSDATERAEISCKIQFGLRPAPQGPEQLQ